jgi:hypothetical protein
MVYYKDFNYTIKTKVYRERGKFYDDNIYTFDIETTSVYVFPDGRSEIFDFQKEPKYYDEAEKCGFMYIWQFSINDKVVYGRTWEEFIEFFTALSKNIVGTFFIYVHNLAFEFQFLRNVIKDFTVFARASRHTMTAKSEKFHCEFRCSLLLTNAPLAKLSKMFDLPVQKMVGELDYNRIRTNKTKLTVKELKYAEYDCLVVYELIKKFMTEYNHVKQIPLTSTGKIRRVCQKMYEGNFQYKHWLKNQLITDVDIFKFVMSAFQGGYTHANYFYTGNVLHNVHSYDITSSYPTVMIAEKYPISAWQPSRLSDPEKAQEGFCYVYDIEFTKIYSICKNHYLSNSKAIEKKDVVYENGRVAQAEQYRAIITNVDYEIIKKVYKWDSVKIHKALIAKAGYLDRAYILKTLELYNNKTTFKDLPGKEDLYMQSKSYINSLYGMMVTNLVTDMIDFSDQEWKTILLDYKGAEEKLQKIATNRKTFLSSSWGVFVTAYARKNLWTMIEKIDDDVIYCDTDSIKYLGDHEKEFEDYNKEIIAKLETTCDFYRIDKEKINPVDTKGKHRPLGVYDREKDYFSFKTLGAKKYAYQYAYQHAYQNADKKIHITIAGVSKAGADALHSLSDFKDGFTFDYKKSGKKILFYNDEQLPFQVTDIDGNTMWIKERYGICLMPCRYTIGVTPDYANYINTTEHFSSAGF